MAFVDPQTVQDPVVGLVATSGWGDAANAAINWIHDAKAGCLVTTTTGTSTSTDTVIPFAATETWDNQSCHSTVSNTSRITIPTNWGGLWAFGANIGCTTGTFHTYIVLNATTKIVGQSAPTTVSVASMLDLMTIYPVSAGDYLEVWVSGGTAIDTGRNNYFWSCFLHQGVA